MENGPREARVRPPEMMRNVENKLLRHELAARLANMRHWRGHRAVISLTKESP